MTRTFTAWAGSLSSGVARAGEGGAGGGVTLVTVADTVWAEHLPAAEDEDPLASDPVFQRQVVGCQLVAASVSRAADSVARTVGGRSLVITTQPSLAVNQVPVVNTVRAGQDEVIIELVHQCQCSSQPFIYYIHLTPSNKVFG